MTSQTSVPPVPARLDERLARYRHMTLRALLAAVPAKEPRAYLYDLVAAQLERGGKGLRPALCLATCRAFGGDAQQALPSAVAIEFLHNSFLVHDDVEDGSELRRDHPTMHVEHGASLAINAGDAMYALSLAPLLQNASLLRAEVAWRVLLEFQQMLLQSVEGQAQELGWIHDNVLDLGEDDYLRMTLKKTCCYTCIFPCRIGALIATDGAADLDRFNLFGFMMGAAFQIQDDILNLAGQRSTYGKEILGDIWEGKRTLMLIHAMRQCSADERERLRDLLAKPRRSRPERGVQWAFALLERYGSIDFARAVARGLAGAAAEQFTVAFRDAPPSDDKDFIGDLVAYMVQRDV